MFFVSDVPGKEVRGEHAHRQCQQFLVSVHGSLSVIVDDGHDRKEVLLDSPSVGLYLPARVWSVQYRFSPDAALAVFASDPYDPADYVRDYEEFLRLAETTRGRARRERPALGRGEARCRRAGKGALRSGLGPFHQDEAAVVTEKRNRAAQAIRRLEHGSRGPGGQTVEEMRRQEDRGASGEPHARPREALVQRAGGEERLGPRLLVPLGADFLQQLEQPAKDAGAVLGAEVEAATG